MGDRSTMVARPLNRILRGAAGVALVGWVGLFHPVGLPNGERGLLGSGAQINPLSRSPITKRLVRGISGASRIPDLSLAASRLPSSRVDPLPSGQRIQDPRLSLVTLRQEGRPAVSITYHLNPIT